MDIICPVCAEPWDIDSLHDNDRELTFAQASRKFRTQGCGAVFDVTCRPARDSSR
jgi:hypothetical protein